MPGVLADVMSDCLPVVESDQPSESVAVVFEQSGSEHVLVVRHGQLIGAISASGCGRCVCRDAPRTAGQLAGRYVIVASERTPVDRVFQAFSSGVDRIVVVLRDGVPVGVVRRTDLFGCGRPERGSDAIPRPHFLGREAASEKSSDVIRPAI